MLATQGVLLICYCLGFLYFRPALVVFAFPENAAAALRLAVWTAGVCVGAGLIGLPALWMRDDWKHHPIARMLAAYHPHWVSR